MHGETWSAKLRSRNQLVKLRMNRTAEPSANLAAFRAGFRFDDAPQSARKMAMETGTAKDAHMLGDNAVLRCSISEREIQRNMAGSWEKMAGDEKGVRVGRGLRGGLEHVLEASRTLNPKPLPCHARNNSGNGETGVEKPDDEDGDGGVAA
jgi:hypothetical protein